MVKQSKKTASERSENYKKAFQSCPTNCNAGFDWIGMPTIGDLVSCMETELDLIEEGQDGAEEYTKRDIAAMKRWIKKWEAFRGE